MDAIDRELRALIEHDFKSRRIDPYVGERPIPSTASPAMANAPGVPLAEASREDVVAAWAQASYKGDASFLFNGVQNIGACLARKFFADLKSNAIKSFFVRNIAEAIAELDDSPVVTNEHQKEAAAIWNKHAKQFLMDMFRAHGKGRKPFGKVHAAIVEWVSKHRLQESAATKTATKTAAKVASRLLSIIQEHDDDGLDEFVEACEIGKQWPDADDIGLLEYKVPSPAELELKHRMRGYLPKGVEPTYYKTPKGLYIASWDFNGTPMAIAFKGKAKKPFMYLRFLSPEARDKRIATIIKTFQHDMERRKKARDERKNFKHDYKVGDILYSTWGYDQTNVDWFEVVGTTDKSVKIRSIYSASPKPGKTLPLPGKYKSARDDTALKGKAVTKRVTPSGSVKIRDHYAVKWDGKPKYETPYGMGH